MTKLVKNRLLKQLHFLKSIGYEYIDDVNLFSSNIKNTKLPNDIRELENSVKHCFLCELAKSRKNVLFGYGNIDANLMFICDEPSSSEDETGNFYIGKNGELLAKMIENVLHIKKEEVYLTNMVKCKSQNGANYTHIDSCNDYLLKQIDLVKPKIIVLLGEKAYTHFFKDRNDFYQIRGKQIDFNGIKVITTYSPAYLLRNPSSKKETFEDMLRVKSLMENI